MTFNLKTYKRLKIKNYLKKINFYFFFHGCSVNNINWIKIEQLLSAENLKCFQIFNTLSINILKNSIFENLTKLIHGPIVFIHAKNNKLILKKLDEISGWINLLCLKLNTKIYSKKQIKNIKKLSYIENVRFLYESIQFFVKMPSYKIKNNSQTFTKVANLAQAD